MLSLMLFETFTSVGYFLKRVFQTHKTRSIVAYSYTYTDKQKYFSGKIRREVAFLTVFSDTENEV